MDSQDTIVAIATPLLSSAIGIIRITGDETQKIIHDLFKKNCNTIKPRQIIYTSLYDPNTDTVLDDCCFIYFKAPYSYTGEESAKSIAMAVYIFKKNY